MEQHELHLQGNTHGTPRIPLAFVVASAAGVVEARQALADNAPIDLVMDDRCELCGEEDDGHDWAEMVKVDAPVDAEHVMGHWSCGEYAGYVLA